ncbi:arabinan endo-1,5-alpha-L-arabinosidase [Actinomadura craniellae]|uniref:Arabinan endo-1,5-alpha-L-arabinosidase n=1 Tax=Actinomadura craniellae TaxID=2231787 RepID=A0A365HAA8_9ACTN|nr:arabinan endo-1,5-alpha-L-arabinosidase [Actinomadura craniellae]RAY15866.1 arabinan endo-1,5-alpha-L-arabinosidase [Actinomadura craniellae]
MTDITPREHRRGISWVSKITAIAAASTLIFATLTGTAHAAYPDPGLVRGDVFTHDPTMIRTSDGTYYTYSTHNGLEARSSTNRIDFAAAGAALPSGASWARQYSGDARELWAPDVSYQNGQYYMYYSASSFGSNHSAIGLAISSTGRPGSWRDRGRVITSSSRDSFNAIDPQLTVDAQGRWWLAFGSWWTGIKMIRIDPATGNRHADRTIHSLAGRTRTDLGIEAPHIVHRGGYYYLFTSWDLCCRGTGSTYKIMVGRSASITGPYVDRNGVRLTSGGGTEVLATHGGRVIGPGGQSVYRDGTQDLLVYHYYDRTDGGRHKLGINYLGIDAAGWPYVW